jgi:hypothetical protein
MALFSKDKLPAELASIVGKRRVLTTVESDAGLVVGLADALVYPSSSGWEQQAWHQIRRGGWDVTAKTLSWIDISGTTVKLVLVKPGRLTDLFKERVMSTIVVNQTVALTDGHSALITARRNLADPRAPLIWQVFAGDDTDDSELDNPTVTAELARLRAQYDSASKIW